MTDTLDRQRQTLHHDLNEGRWFTLQVSAELRGYEQFGYYQFKTVGDYEVSEIYMYPQKENETL